MIAEACVSKDKKPKAAEVIQEAVAEVVSVDAVEYTEHILVPVPFKEQLERIAQRVNQNRRRQKLPKRPLGWFVVRHLRDWMNAAEAGQVTADDNLP